MPNILSSTKLPFFINRSINKNNIEVSISLLEQDQCFLRNGPTSGDEKINTFLELFQMQRDVCTETTRENKIIQKRWNLIKKSWITKRIIVSRKNIKILHPRSRNTLDIYYMEYWRRYEKIYT